MGSFPGLAGEETFMGADEPPIHPVEARFVAGAVARRRIEFATGRACARRALSLLGIQSFVLEVGEHRAPRWPSGVVGSITHTWAGADGYCAVVVGRTEHFTALGIDAERVGALSPSLWPMILTEGERRWLQDQDEPSRDLFASVVFSAKESFFKAQFPVTSRFLEFREVEVVLEPAGQTFVTRVASPAPGMERLSRCEGQFMQRGAIVLTGIALAAGGAAP